MSKTTKRTGKSLIHTINDCPTALMLTLGFTEEQAARMINVRRVLPLVEDSTVPWIDARKLWGRIGKPHGQFRKWAEHYIKPLLAESGMNGEIRAFVDSSKPGKPSKHYTLSRDVAAELAMQARTDEGREIRRYFLDMEKLAVRLSGYLPVRAHSLTTADRDISHHLFKLAGDAAKEGRIPRWAVKDVATAKDKALKSTVCEILTGKTAGHWREVLGSGKGIRDVLNPEQLAAYADCLNTAAVLVRAGMGEKEQLVRILAPYANRIDISDYLPEVIRG